MPSLDDEPFECMVLPSNDKRMSEESSSPTVVLRSNRANKSKESEANLSTQNSKEECEKEKVDSSEKDPLLRVSESDNSTSNRGYFAETVDFPDSPLHLKLLKKRNREAQGLDTEDDEDESTTFSIMGHHSSQRPKKERPKSLNTSKSLDSRRKITVNADILTSDLKDDDQRSIDSLSYRSLTALDDLVTPDDIDTPDDLDDDLFDNTLADDIEGEGGGPWVGCVVGGEERRIDLKVIEPYKKVLSHGGYIGSPHLVIIVFSACYLPDHARLDYDYVMDNLFLYVLTTLAQLVAQDYVLIYLHGATSRSCMPTFGWLKRCYQMIDRRLRKNLKGLYLVHPTFWLKTIVIMTKPFISSKFSRKLRFVNNLQELEELIPMDHVCIPDKVKEYDEKRMLMAAT